MSREVINMATALQIARPGLPQVSRASQPARVPVFTPEHIPAGLPISVHQAALMLCDPEVPAVKQIPTAELIDELFEPLQVVPFLLGHSNTLISAKDLIVLATAVAEMVQRRFPGFRVAEIGLALRRGCSGEWQKEGEIMTVSLPTIAGWLKSYQDSCRAVAINALQRQQLLLQQKALPRPDLTADYPRQVAELAAWVKATISEKHPSGRFPEHFDDGNLLYDWLKQLGVLSIKTKEQYAVMMRKEALLHAERYPAGLSEQRQIRTLKDALRRGFLGDHPLADTVVNACRKRLLREWVLLHIGRGTDLQQWLTDLQHHPHSAAA